MLEDFLNHLGILNWDVSIHIKISLKEISIYLEDLFDHFDLRLKDTPQNIKLKVFYPFLKMLRTVL